MKTSIGLWDRLFGKKVTMEIPHEGTIVNRIVSKKWLDQMIEQGKMSTVPKKEQIDCKTTIQLLLTRYSDESQQNWSQLKITITDFEQIFGHLNEDWVQYEFTLAAMGSDLLALYNLFPKVKADELTATLIENINIIEEIGVVSVEAVLEYFDVAQQALDDAIPPIDYVVSLLLQRLEITEVESNMTVLLTELIVVVSSMIGKWKWINETYIVV